LVQAKARSNTKNKKGDNDEEERWRKKRMNWRKRIRRRLLGCADVGHNF